MEVKRREKMKTSLQFNVRTWHSAAGRWPFRYFNWWLSLLRVSLSLALSSTLRERYALTLRCFFLSNKTNSICLSTIVYTFLFFSFWIPFNCVSVCVCISRKAWAPLHVLAKLKTLAYFVVVAVAVECVRVCNYLTTVGKAEGTGHASQYENKIYIILIQIKYNKTQLQLYLQYVCMCACIYLHLYDNSQRLFIVSMLKQLFCWLPPERCVLLLSSHHVTCCCCCWYSVSLYLSLPRTHTAAQRGGTISCARWFSAKQCWKQCKYRFIGQSIASAICFSCWQRTQKSSLQISRRCSFLLWYCGDFSIKLLPISVKITSI